MPGPAARAAQTRRTSRLNRLLDRVTALAAWAVLPLALLLFAQWPLRDGLGAGARLANDAAQTIFALYVALALRQATRDGAHLAADTLSARYPARVRRALARWGATLAVLPFALFVLVTGAASTWRSIAALEAFPDTFNPGYFLIKLAAWLLALAMALQAVADLVDPTDPSSASDGVDRPAG